MATSNPSEQAQQRPRSKSILSFGSNKSGKSLKSAGGKMDLKETTTEKRRSRITGKADPTLAMSEEEPASVAVGNTSIESLRAIQHRDRNGNLIVDPDRSNPTRNRCERPLDTIRSFEAAIDGSYNRRSTYRRNDATDSPNSYSRRSSYHQGARHPHDNGYYGNRPSPSRPESFVDHYNGPNGYYRPRFAPRLATEPALNTTPTRSQPPPHGVYPVPGYQRSYDTVVTSASGTGSNSTEQWGNSTDPSSDNSSIERVPPPPKPDLGEAYGFSGFGGAPDLQNANYLANQNVQQGQAGPSTAAMSTPAAMGRYEPARNEVPPGVPPKVPPHAPMLRTPIKLGETNTPSSAPPAKAEKRKSWFRRFSRG
ncbi:MAG: hypothetical protein M1816_002064 [Peltula sp. TS41687]|nr:MAG: hypothetical protein M1816_002064 [Peltula sp. TS41687]